jgi:2-oxoglutarate ferredoxin oxidoreductase subunit delta
MPKPTPDVTDSGTTTIKSRGTVTIDIDHCKGCDLCIPACPPGVLAMSVEVNHMGYRYPELYPGCTGCAACSYVCPDFVFEVFRFDQPVLTEVTS